MNAKQYLRIWLRSHGAAERRLQAALRRHFTEQAAEIAERVRAGADASQAFDLAEATAALLDIVRPWLVRSAAQGAATEFALFEGHRPEKAGTSSDFNLPAPVYEAIDRTIGQTLRRPYWQGVGRTTRENIHQAILEGIDEGDSQDALATRVRRALAGTGAEERALIIARTESTGALNAGHHAARQQLIQEGLIGGSEWVTMGDDVVRETHLAADGQTIGAHEQFSIGGELCPYPGYFGLSAGERINCRCTTVAAGIFGADE
ncbi:MAG: phage minor head protein [Pirellulales bacterium]